MRKQDYVHLHSLLVVLLRFLNERETITADRLSGYEALGTRPTDIHASKRAHRSAVLELSEAISQGVDQSGRVRSHEAETPTSTDY
jgi:hypothetical protein